MVLFNIRVQDGNKPETTTTLNIPHDVSWDKARCEICAHVIPKNTRTQFRIIYLIKDGI